MQLENNGWKWSEDLFLDIVARVKEILRGEDLNKHTRRDMEQYVKQIDEKLTKNMNVWQTKMNLLNQEKKNLFKSVWKM